MENKKELGIVFGATGNMAFAVANVLIGLRKTNSFNLKFDIIIFHDNITEKDQAILNSILPCKFLIYEFPIRDLSGFNMNFFNQFTRLAYSRYECFNLLNEYKKIIWLDIDVLIQDRIDGLLDYCSTGMGILPGEKVGSLFFKPVFNFDMDKKGYSTGTIVLQDNLPNYDKLAPWCYEKTHNLAEYLYLPDQGIVNLMIQDFLLEVQEIDVKKYCCHPTDKDYKNAIIVHSYYPEKFWNFYNIKRWNENNKEWLKLGGSRYNGKRAYFITRFIKKFLPQAPDPIRKPRQFLLYIRDLISNNSKNSSFQDRKK